MDTREFVETIKTVVLEDSIKAVESNLIKPPGRKPSEKLLKQSQWFNKLTEDNKNMVLSIVRESVETCTLGFLCVLDGTRQIEGSGEKGVLKLTFEKNGEAILLNSTDLDMHELI